MEKFLTLGYMRVNISQVKTKKERWPRPHLQQSCEKVHNDFYIGNVGVCLCAGAMTVSAFFCKFGGVSHR